MDKKYYTQLANRDDQIEMLASAITNELCSTYYRLLSGAEKDIEQLILETIITRTKQMKLKQQQKINYQLCRKAVRWGVVNGLMKYTETKTGLPINLPCVEKGADE